MPEHYNGLTPAEAERLAILLEELGEVQQVIGKILRHGYESYPPNEGPTNRERLEQELGHVQFIINLMCLKDVLKYHVNTSAKERSLSIIQWLHHQAEA